MYKIQKYVENIKHPNIINQEIKKNGVSFKVLCKSNNFINFKKLPLDISKLIYNFSVEYMEIDIFLHLFLIIDPMECYLYWEFIDVLKYNFEIDKKYYIINNYKKIIKSHNKVLVRKKHILFYFNNLDTNLKNLINEIYSFITNMCSSHFENLLISYQKTV